MSISVVYQDYLYFCAICQNIQLGVILESCVNINVDLHLVVIIMPYFSLMLNNIVNIVYFLPCDACSVSALYVTAILSICLSVHTCMLCQQMPSTVVFHHLVATAFCFLTMSTATKF